MISHPFATHRRFRRNAPKYQGTCGTWYLAPQARSADQVDRVKKNRMSQLAFVFKKVSNCLSPGWLPPWRIYWPKFLKKLLPCSPFAASAVRWRYKIWSKEASCGLLCLRLPNCGAVFQCTTDCTHKKKGYTLKMGPFKTVGGLHASGWQIAIFYRGTAMAPSLKSRLGCSGEGEASLWKAGAEPRPSPPPRWLHLDHLVGSALVFSNPGSISCLVQHSLSRRLWREKLGHAVNITHLTNSKFALKRQPQRLTFAKWLPPLCGKRCPHCY